MPSANYLLPIEVKRKRDPNNNNNDDDVFDESSSEEEEEEEEGNENKKKKTTCEILIEMLLAESLPEQISAEDYFSLQYNYYDILFLFFEAENDICIGTPLVIKSDNLSDGVSIGYGSINPRVHRYPEGSYALYQFFPDCNSGGGGGSGSGNGAQRHRLIVHFVRLASPEAESGSHHSNLIIINTRDRTIELFEPHGKTSHKNHSKISALQYALLRARDSPYNGYKVITPLEYCPANGPQSIWGGYKGTGFCKLFSLIYAWFRMKCTTATKEEIISYLIKDGNANKLEELMLKFLYYVRRRVKESPIFDIFSGYTKLTKSKTYLNAIHFFNDRNNKKLFENSNIKKRFKQLSLELVAGIFTNRGWYDLNRLNQLLIQIKKIVRRVMKKINSATEGNNNNNNNNNNFPIIKHFLPIEVKRRREEEERKEEECSFGEDALKLNYLTDNNNNNNSDIKNACERILDIINKEEIDPKLNERDLIKMYDEMHFYNYEIFFLSLKAKNDEHICIGDPIVLIDGVNIEEFNDSRWLRSLFRYYPECYDYDDVTLVIHFISMLSSSGTSHSNALIINMEEDTIELFEPNGGVFEKYQKMFNNLIEAIRRDDIYKDYQLILPQDYCPIGPQRIWGGFNRGFCTLYSLLYTWMRIECKSSSNKEIVEYMKRNMDPHLVKEIMIKFLLYVMRTVRSDPKYKILTEYQKLVQSQSYINVILGERILMNSSEKIDQFINYSRELTEYIFVPLVEVDKKREEFLIEKIKSIVDEAHQDYLKEVYANKVRGMYVNIFCKIRDNNSRLF